MQIRILKLDTATTDLVSIQKRVADLGPMHKAIGVQIVSMTKEAFNEAALRPSTWPAKYGGAAATLKKTGTLFRSVRVINADGKGVTVGADRKYAAIHQLGGQTKPHKITAKNGKALAFGGSYRGMGGAVTGGIGTIVVRSVNHPGSKIPARPFLPFMPDGSPTVEADKRIRQTITAYIAARPGK